VTRSRTTVVALCLLALAAIAAAPAAVAAKKAPARAARIDILAPRVEARVGATLLARVKVSTTKGFSASLAGHNVTKRFHRHGGVMEAELKRGRDYRLGHNALLIAAGTGRAMRAYTARFVSRAHDGGLVTVTRLDPGSESTPLRFRVKVSHRVARLKVDVDGHRIATAAGEQRRRTWTFAVGAADGAHFGSNTLRASAERVDGESYDGETIPFTVSRAAPLVGAGPNRRTRPGLAVPLDGTRTQAGKKNGVLAYRWQIVGRPKGSHAGIVDATRRDGRLLPDLPGTYRVRLQVARTTKRAAAERTKRAKGAATASAATAPEPVCLPFLALIPAASETGGEEEALTPLEAPNCVTPTGETSPPPLPAAAPTAADEMVVTVPPTISPMGVPLETITSNGGVLVGKQEYAPQSPFGFANLVDVNKTTLKVEGQATVNFEKPQELYEAILNASPNSFTIIGGIAPTEQGQVPPAAVEALATAIEKLHGRAPSNSKLAELIGSGQWSVVGSRELDGYFAANFARAAEATPVETTMASKVGSLNGHLQPNKSGVVRYVSTEFVPIDTKAAGSSEVKSVFKLGSETLEAEIPSHSLGLHIGVFNGESPSGKLTQLANLNYTLVNNGNTNGQGVEEAANELHRWRVDPANVLIVMQTYGEEGIAPTTAPTSSQYWVNDGLLEATEEGLFQWKEQPYAKIENESETEEVLDRLWNKEYPTVAGQVGDLTGYAGHDLVANFGVPNVYRESSSAPVPVESVEISRLTMVAANHAQTPEANYVSGTAKTANGTPEGRLVGVLTRNDEGGWAVKNGSSQTLWEASKIWETAYAEPTAWPYPEEEGGKVNAENKLAMQLLCQELFGKATTVTNLRTLYPTILAADAGSDEAALGRITWEASRDPVGKETFEGLRNQLITELRDIVQVKTALTQWRTIFGKETRAVIDVNAATSQVISEVLKDYSDRSTAEAEVNPEAIIAESLYTVADLAGFPEATEFLKVPEIVGVMAGGVALAEASTPEPESTSEGPETEEIRIRADELEKTFAERIEGNEEGLIGLEAILVSDWGKLKAAGGEAQTKWTPEPAVEAAFEQALAVNTERQVYEALMPYAYQEWVVSPYVTNTNGGGPQAPGTSYYCKSYYGEGEYNGIHPFAKEPAGGLSTATYRPSAQPGASAKPAQPYTQPYSIRALKSTKDPLRMVSQELEGGHEIVAIHNSGDNPGTALVDPLFEPVLTGEHRGVPSHLGINKTEFFADYGEGPNDWKRAICAEH
jgi:hypothetical protein